MTTFKYLAIDVGQTKTRYVLESENGERVEKQTGGLTHTSRDVLNQILLGIDLILEQRELDNLQVAIGFTHIPISEIQISILRNLARRAMFQDLIICGDELTSHLGAIGLNSGVVMAAGTGISCTSLHLERGFRTFGGYGYLISDEGSGYWIGREAIRKTLKIVDRDESETLLTKLVKSKFGDVSNLVEDIYNSDSPSKLIASIASMVIELSKLDSDAKNIVDDAINEISAQIINALSISGTSMFSFAGGILQEAVMRDSVRKSVEAKLDSAKFREASGTAVEGGLFLIKNFQEFAAIAATWDYQPHFKLLQ